MSAMKHKIPKRYRTLEWQTRLSILAGLLLLACLLYPLSFLTPSHTNVSQSTATHAQRTLNNALFIDGPYTLTATEIDGTNAHLEILPDPLSPVLSFTSTTIYGLRLTHALTATSTLTISSGGAATADGVSIETSILNDLKVALGNISAADLATLLVGGTVKQLTLQNVNMEIDNYMDAQSLNLPNASISVE